MRLRYQTEKLERLLREFHRLTGISISVLDADFHPLIPPPAPLRFCTLIQNTREGAARCFRSDSALLRRCMETGLPATHKCHAGLTDTAAPIMKDGMLLGFIIFGQVCSKGNEHPSLSRLLSLISDLGIPENELRQAYGELRFFEPSQIESAAEIVSILTKYIWLEHLIQPQFNDDFEKLIDYVESHFAEPLSVALLCRRFHISKNTLYRRFRTHFNCTVNEYVGRLRMRRAEELLRTTDLPIYEVCERSGLENYQYFCRRFKKEKGITPLQYRKQSARTIR